MRKSRITRTLVPAVLACTLTLTGCTGGGSPAGTQPSPTTSTAPTISTGNAAVDSALNSLGDVRTALDGVRALGNTTSSSFGTSGFRVAGFAIRQTAPSGTASAPPAFRDPQLDQPGERVEEREMPQFDGKTFAVIKIKIKVVIIQEQNRRIRRETDITAGEPGRLISESIHEQLTDGNIRDTNTNIFVDPQGNFHKIVNISVHPPFDPSRFQFDPNAPPPAPPDGEITESLSTDGGKTFIKVGEGRTQGGKTNSSRKFKDPRGVEIEETSSSDPTTNENSNERKENGLVVFSHSRKIIKEGGRILIREIEDNTFVDPAGIKRRHKGNILRLGDFFGGFAPQPAPLPATSAGAPPFVAKQTSGPSPGTPPPGTGTTPSQPPSGGGGTPGPAPLPGIGLALPDPGHAPVPPGTLQASIEDFENDKLVHKLEYRNDTPSDPTKASIKEIFIDRETGKELPADEVTVNADGSRTVVKHLPNGNTVTMTINPNLPGAQALEEKSPDGKLVHKVERSGNTIIETFYGPPGSKRHVMRGTITGPDGGTFEEFDVRNGQEVKVAVGRAVGGKFQRFGPDGTTALGDDFGTPNKERKRIDADTDEETTTVEVGGKKIKLVKKIKKVKRETFAGVGSNGQFQAPQTSESEAVGGVQQIIDDNVTVDFDDDITQVDKTKLKMRFKSNMQFAGKIEKGSSQANLDGDLTTSDGRKFKVKITQTTGSIGLSGTIDLTTDDGRFNINMDLDADGSGVGTVKDLQSGVRIFTISISISGRAVVRDKDDRPVANDVQVFKKA